MTPLVAVWGAVLIGLAGCPSVPPLSIPEGCEPLAADLHCGMPYPSDAFLVDDTNLPSGHRVEIPRAAELLTATGGAADITEFMPQDGFSRQGPIVWTFGVAVDVTSVPGLGADPQETLKPGAPIALLRASDGERVPFFVDVDPRASDPARQALVMRPLVRLDAETRYVVAVSGVVAAEEGAEEGAGEGAGKEVAVPEGFRRLRDGVDAVGDDPMLRPLLERFDDEVFPVIQDAGIDREKLQLAWDFTTGSDRHVSHDMLRARTLALEALADTPPTVTVDAVFEGAALARVLDNNRPELTWRMVRLELTGPRVVENDRPGTLLNRDDDGEVALNGTTSFDVTVLIPASVRDGFDPGPALLYGHGFFGGQVEVESSTQREIANRAGRVIFCLDWLGMSLEDIGVVSGSIGNQVSEALRFGERLPQAMVNWLTLTAAIEGGLLDDVETTVSGDVVVRPFRRPAAGEGTSVVDGESNAGGALLATDRISFLGQSLGHILGGVLIALNGGVENAVLEVGGASFANIMFRALPFEGFLFFLDRSVPDPLDQQLLAAQLQRAFDRFDPATYAPWVLAEELPEGPSANAARRRVLMAYGRADSQVPNMGTQLHMRYLDLPWVTPGPFEAPFGLETVDAPHEGSGAFAFDLGFDPAEELVADFPTQTPVHDALRGVDEVQLQMTTFFNEGVVVNPCAPATCGVLRR